MQMPFTKWNTVGCFEVQQMHHAVTYRSEYVNIYVIVSIQEEKRDKQREAEGGQCY